jgi:DNA-binding MarR family transcriptional regulator
MAGKSDSGSKDLAAAMVALVRSFGLHRPDETPCGEPVPVAEAHALMDLAAQGPLNHGELAARLRLEKSTVSRLVRQLEKRKWIKRTSAARDRRVIHIQLTPSGQAAAQRLADARHSKFDDLLAVLPKAKRASILEAMSTLVNAMDDARSRR